MQAARLCITAHFDIHALVACGSCKQGQGSTTRRIRETCLESGFEPSFDKAFCEPRGVAMLATTLILATPAPAFRRNAHKDSKATFLKLAARSKSKAPEPINAKSTPARASRSKPATSSATVIAIDTIDLRTRSRGYVCFFVGVDGGRTTPARMSRVSTGQRSHMRDGSLQSACLGRFCRGRLRLILALLVGAKSATEVGA